MVVRDLTVVVAPQVELGRTVEVMVIAVVAAVALGETVMGVGRRKEPI